MTAAPPNHAVPLSRRAMLAGSAGALAAGVGAVLWSSGDEESAAAPKPSKPAPPKKYSAFESGSFSSAARGGADTHWQIQRPEGVDAVVLHPVILLHRQGDDYKKPFESLGLPTALTDAVSAGVTPFALCSVDAQLPNGSDSFYHARSAAGGKTVDAGEMVLKEFIPMLAGHGLDIAKVAFWGWTMGGYGALRLGALYNQAHPGAVAGIVAVTPALGVSGPPVDGAFDGVEDYRRNSVWSQATLDELNKIPLRVDYGSSDEYVAGARRLVGVLNNPKLENEAVRGDRDSVAQAKVKDELKFLGMCFGPR